MELLCCQSWGDYIFSKAKGDSWFQLRIQNLLLNSSDEEMLMAWIWVAVIGLIVGAVAKLLMPGRDPGGIMMTILLGIAGSLVATWAGRAMGLYGPGQAAGFIMSVIGAILLLAIYHMARGRTA
jgi:uncharacterized membrane protein YeaQ/YmgE (transglycosylase-associated protein family)